MITVHFYLRFRSSFGQQFFISGNTPALGNADTTAAKPLHYLNEDLLHLSIDLPANTPAFTYKYLLRHDDGTESMEWPTDRMIDVSNLKAPEIQVLDYWNYAGEYENAFYTQPFQETLFQFGGDSVKTTGKKGVNHIFRVKAPLLAANETMCLIGSDEKLGAWDTNKCLPMTREGHWYTTHCNLSEASFPITYKYGVYNVAAKSFVRYEGGDNRLLFGMVKKQLVILHDGFAALPNNTFKGAGVAIPVFSLRSSNGLGIGEFNDLMQLADWATKTGMKLIQLLPINDTSATGTSADSYPYAAISAFALHPQYINLETVAGKKYAALLKGLPAEKKKLNALKVVDYEAVMGLKWQYLNALYEAQKDSWQKDDAYQQYFAENKHWLEPYAAFCYLRDKYKTAAYNTWKTHSKYDAKNVAKLISPQAKSYDAVAIHLFVQWHLHLQLKAAVDYAHQQGLVVKGDIPIGIYRHSCDAWLQPDLYNMDAQAGAPPDDFAIAGQNWGFPTYNWQQMQADGFAWWKQRFEQMSLYFDAFRIDHILGFFRIWSIPMHAVEGILGRFVPSLPVHINEFSEKGIWFDYNRYCQPFINEQLVNEWFGEKAEWVKETFLDDGGWGNFKLKEAFDTQRKVEAWFAEHVEAEEWIKQHLYDCISNVILIEEPGSKGTQFHFRISMENTSSFQWLDEHTRRQLSNLYVHYFFRRQNDFWRQQAMQKLPALKASTNMLICGEDLGMVPECVPGVMKDLGFLSLEIQRMPKDPTKQFFHPGDAPYLSVVTPSTHDMSTIRGWWEESRETTQKFYNEQLGQWGEAPIFCEPWINRAIITQHVYSPAMWSIFQLQDLLGSSASLRRENPQEERINIPANPKHYWRYRMHFSLEQLMIEEDFNDDLRSLLQNSGRCS